MNEALVKNVGVVCMLISVRSWNFKDGGSLKASFFGQESTCHQGKFFKEILQVMTVCQKVPKLYFQSQFWMSKIFQKKILSKNINLRDHYLLKTFFS